MKRVIVAALLLVSTFTYAGNEIDLRAFADRFIAAEHLAWEEGKFEALQTIESPNVVYHGIGIDSFEAHKQYIINARATVTAMKQEFKYIVGDGSLFALDYSNTSVADGQTVQSTALMLFKVTDGQVSDVWFNATTTEVEDE